MSQFLFSPGGITVVVVYADLDLHNYCLLHVVINYYTYCVLEMHQGGEEEEKEGDGPELRHRREPALAPVHHSGVTGTTP